MRKLLLLLSAFIFIGCGDPPKETTCPICEKKAKLFSRITGGIHTRDGYRCENSHYHWRNGMGQLTDLD